MGIWVISLWVAISTILGNYNNLKHKAGEQLGIIATLGMVTSTHEGAQLATAVLPSVKGFSTHNCLIPVQHLHESTLHWETFMLLRWVRRDN